jgi:ribosomal protein L15
MGVRYSYSDYTTKGHGVIETGGEGRDDSAYMPGGGMTPEYKFVKTATHVDQIAASIKSMSPNRKRASIETLRLSKGVRVGKTIYVKLKGDGKMNIYARPVARKASKSSTKRPAANSSSYEEIYNNLKRINDRARSRGSK